MKVDNLSSKMIQYRLKYFIISGENNVKSTDKIKLIFKIKINLLNKFWIIKRDILIKKRTWDVPFCPINKIK